MNRRKEAPTVRHSLIVYQFHWLLHVSAFAKAIFRQLKIEYMEIQGGSNMTGNICV
jgi:hypothetical protein